MLLVTLLACVVSISRSLRKKNSRKSGKPQPSVSFAMAALILKRWFFQRNNDEQAAVATLAYAHIFLEALFMYLLFLSFVFFFTFPAF